MSTFSMNTPGLSFYSIPLVWLVGIWPQRKRIDLINKALPRGFDNSQPLSNIGRLHEYPGVRSETVEQVDRAEGAYQNSVELMPLWIGAVLAGNQAGLDNGLMNVASVAFIGFRMLYNYIYLQQSNKKEAGYRSYAWLASIAIPMTLFIKAANRIRAMRTT